MSTRISKILVDELENVGVDHAFGLVGDTILSVLDDFSRSDIRYISTRHEQVATGMAAGYALATRQPAVSIAHVGPGAANQVLGLTAAFKENIPVISITGNEPSYKLGKDVNHEWDVTGVFEHFTKDSIRLTDQDPRTQVRGTLLRTLVGMPGPVHLDAPKDILEKEITEGENRNIPDVPQKRASSSSIRPDTDSISGSLELLRAADRPLIIAGNEFRWFPATPELVELAELIAIPVATTQNSRGALPETHPRSIGYVANSRIRPTNEYFERADLVIAIGVHLNDQVTGDWELISKDTNLVHATVRDNKLNDHYVADVGVIADPQSFLRELTSEISSDDRPFSFAGVADEVREAYEETRRGHLTPSSNETSKNGVDPRTVVGAVAEQLDEVVYTTGGGVHNIFPRLLPVSDLNGRFVTANFTGMAQGLPLAMGAQLALDKQVITFEGDGGFAMVMQDLETAVRERIPVKVIVLNNQAYMSHYARQRWYYDGQHIGTEHGNPKFDMIAESFGAFGQSVESDAEIEQAVSALLDYDGPGVLDVHIDPEIGLDWFKTGA